MSAMEDPESVQTFAKKYGATGMQETQGGTAILRALMRVSEKISSLEEARRASQIAVSTLKNSENPEIHRTLSLAEARCSLLEEQLHSLREFLNVSFKSSAITSTKVHQPLNLNISKMPREHNRSTPSHYSGMHPTPVESLSYPFEPVLDSGKRRTRQHSRQLQKTGSVSSGSKSTTLSHYHFKLANMPFIPSTSTGPSYSLGANIQNLRSLVNSHNPNHRRGRSSSADRLRPVRSKPSDAAGSLPRWRSLSDVSRSRKLSSSSSERRRSQSNRPSPDLMSDLDTVPVRLEKNLNRKANINGNACEDPGKVCIKTELHSQPRGCSKTFEVKMTTRGCAPTCLKGKANLGRLQNDRQLLRNLRDLQSAMRRDQYPP